jgi:hypothetical protein
LAGVVALGVGGYALWRGTTLPKDDETDPETRRRSMVRLMVAGIMLVGLGTLAIRHALT